MISVSSTAEMLAGLRTARNVTFAAYFLKRGAVADGLEAAAKRGAHVQVRLDGYLYGGSARWSSESHAAARSLRRAGANVRFVHCGKDDGPGMHIKAAVCDRVAFLDDCNWARGGDTVVRDDDPDDVKAIRKAVLQREARANGAFEFTKYSALAAEAETLACGSHARTVEVETEQLGNSAVSRTLRDLLAHRVKCRVLVSERAFTGTKDTTRVAALSLQKAGADVRMTKASEKLAVAGGHAWIGSANASAPFYNAHDIDWSLSTSDARVVRALKSHFSAHWRASAPLPIVAPPATSSS